MTRRNGLLVLGGVVVLAVGLAAGLALGLSHGNTATRTLTATTVEVVNGERNAGPHPAPIPNFLEGARGPHELDLADAVPRDASLLRAYYVDQKPQQLIVTWGRVHRDRNWRAEWERRGIAIWQRDPGLYADTWHRVFTFENPLTKALGTVEDFFVTTGDISGDGRPEVLVNFYRGGSAGLGTYHLFANSGPQLRQPFVKELRLDHGAVSIEHGTLVMREGLEHFSANIHCCYRKVRTTIARWNGHRLVTVRSTVDPIRR